MLGTYALSAGYYDAYYLKALKVRRLIRQDYDDAFKQVDLIAGPVTSTPAFKIGEKSDDPLAMYLVDLYTVSANLAGIGGIAFPCGFSTSGLPIGLQLQGPPFEEDRLLRAAHMFQTGHRLAHAQAAAVHEISHAVRTCPSHYTIIIGLEVHVQLLTADQAVLRLQHEVRRAAEYADLPGLHRHAGHAAGDESHGVRAGPENGRGAELQDRAVHEVGSQELLLSRLAQGLSDQPVRSAVSARRASWRSAIPRAASSRRKSASSAPIWKKTPARACTTKWPARPTAGSI